MGNGPDSLYKVSADVINIGMNIRIKDLQLSAKNP